MVERVEVITGMERRRYYSEDFKEELVRRALSPGANNSAIAREHGITPSLLFKWKKDYGPALLNCRKQELALPKAGFIKLEQETKEPTVSEAFFIHYGELLIELPQGTDPRRLAVIVKSIKDLACVR